jgi:hypothetical protein
VSASRVAGRRTQEPHVCASCDLSFVYPEFGIPIGTRWRVLLRCPSCGWSGETTLDDADLERFERVLDDERDQIALELERLTQQNMREYYDLFVAALEADAILPEDF